jgi:hypothetical protein
VQSAAVMRTRARQRGEPCGQQQQANCTAP